MSICGNMVGGLIIPKSFVLVDENNVELVGVTVGEETVLTANASTDIREGMVAATEEGVVTGTKRIPAYETSCGNELILPDQEFTISMLDEFERYNYTQLQCIITVFETDIDSSVSTEKVVINDGVYNTNSTIKLSDVTKDSEFKTVKLNITNDTENIYLIRYFTYKEEL